VRSLGVSRRCSAGTYFFRSWLLEGVRLQKSFCCCYQRALSFRSVFWDWWIVFCRWGQVFQACGTVCGEGGKVGILGVAGGLCGGGGGKVAVRRSRPIIGRGGDSRQKKKKLFRRKKWGFLK